MEQKKILIVDDETAMRFLLGKQLSRAGFQTATAADGHAALAALAREPFDAVVLDVIMPGIDGFEVCRRIKAGPQTAALPIIFLSASSSGDYRRRAFQVGAADFLAKPYQIRDLPAYIHSILQRAGRPAPSTGRVVSVIGTNRQASGAQLATRLAETAALQGPSPVMLIDLELPAGRIGAKLQLSGGPNMRLLLQDTGEPVTMETIARVSQRYHAALEVMPAPFSPSMLNATEPVPQRLEAVLDILIARGYHVVIHVGGKIDELTLTAMRRSETIRVATADEKAGAFEALRARLTAAGIPDEQIVAARPDTTGSYAPIQPGSARPLAPVAEKAAMTLTTAV